MEIYISISYLLKYAKYFIMNAQLTKTCNENIAKHTLRRLSQTSFVIFMPDWWLRSKMFAHKSKFQFVRLTVCKVLQAIHLNFKVCKIYILFEANSCSHKHNSTYKYAPTRNGKYVRMCVCVNASCCLLVAGAGGNCSTLLSSCQQKLQQ